MNRTANVRVEARASALARDTEAILAKLTAGARPYLHVALAEIERRGLPAELALLPQIESSFNPAATSHAAAAGMWQFIPSTGVLMGLHQSPHYDGRRDLLESTRAALDYLEQLHQRLGVTRNWRWLRTTVDWAGSSRRRPPTAPAVHQRISGPETSRPKPRTTCQRSWRSGGWWQRRSNTAYRCPHCRIPHRLRSSSPSNRWISGGGAGRPRGHWRSPTLERRAQTGTLLNRARPGVLVPAGAGRGDDGRTAG